MTNSGRRTSSTTTALQSQAETLWHPALSIGYPPKARPSRCSATTRGNPFPTQGPGATLRPIVTSRNNECEEDRYARIEKVNLSPIETERLVLHPLRVSDAHEMAPVLADPSLYEFTGGEPPTLDTLQQRYRNQTAGSDKSDEVWCNWIIRTKTGERAVGFVQATVTGHSADLAWVVGVRDQGRGFATEGAAAACEWLAINNAVSHIEAHIHPEHVASLAVAARIGLIPTGELDNDGEEIWATERTPNLRDTTNS